MGRAVKDGFGVGRREVSRRSLLVVQGAVAESWRRRSSMGFSSSSIVLMVRFVYVDPVSMVECLGDDDVYAVGE